jgi:ABC-type branched-subunit amino acid transport system ATPase component
LLDEPAAGLIAEEISGLADIILALRATGMTVLLIEPHIDLVVRISDRATVLDYGAVSAQAHPRWCNAMNGSNPRVVEAYLGTAS